MEDDRDEMSPEELGRLNELRAAKQKAIREQDPDAVKKEIRKARPRTSKKHKNDSPPVDAQSEPPLEKKRTIPKTPPGYRRRYYFVAESLGYDSFKFYRGKHVSRPIENREEAIRWFELVRHATYEVPAELYLFVANIKRIDRPKNQT